VLDSTREYLASELADAPTAARVAPWLIDVGLTWAPPTASLDSFAFVIGYSFGNRTPPGGGDPTKVLPLPGPVNKQLADTIAAITTRRTMPVYAQWEIARILASEHAMTDVVSIEPVRAADGTITYLSTDGVAAQILSKRKTIPSGVGRACIVGFRDHVKRCVLTTRARGIDAYAPDGISMPDTYDPHSAQAWTRRRDVYLVHDMGAQWAMKKSQLLAELYPNG
jgi:hypothetical protein